MQKYQIRNLQIESHDSRSLHASVLTFSKLM
jgi:hypothetical protein